MKTIPGTRAILAGLCLLWICGGAGLQSTMAAVERVICVPWLGDPDKYHTAISGLSVRIKGVIKTTTAGDHWFKWVYADGTESAVVKISGALSYNVESDHVYTGSAGTPFTARLMVDAVDSSMSHAVSDTYLVKIETTGLDARVNLAIDNGLWYLHKQKFSNGNTLSYNGKPVGVWIQNTYGTSYSSPTASAVQSFEINGHKQTGDPNEDPYVTDVKEGLNWLLAGRFGSTPMLRTVNIGLQHGDNPDSDGNGKGIEVVDTYPRTIYQGGMVMDAIISSGTPDADSGRDFDGDGNNETYREVIQDMCDMYAWGQCDQAGGGGILGGWRYAWHEFPDNSAAQWAAIGMIPAQQPPWNCVVPQWVKTHNNTWLTYSFQQFGTSGIWGGFGYTGPSHGEGTTPSGMVQLAFVGATRSDTRWAKSERWFADNWTAWLNGPADWTKYGYYAFVKAMRLALPTPITTLQQNGLDWYRGDATRDGIAKRLCDPLIANHSWTGSGYQHPNLLTAWAVIMLRPSLFQEAPIACFNAQPNPNFANAPIEFDPSCSGHSDPTKSRDNLVLYEWDWNSDGVFDEATTTPSVVLHSFPCTSVPCIIPVTLRVTDDFGGTATYQQDMQITNPPHPPVARTSGPFWVSLCDVDSLKLDASSSFDVDQGQHQAGCPTCPDDMIISWKWDLNGAPFTFEGASGPVVDVPNYKTIYSAVGVYDIGVRVTDNTALSFPGAGKPNLTDDEFAQVFVYAAGICDITATTRCQGVDLTWANVSGATGYIVYLSASGPNYGFTQVAQTTSPSASINGLTLGVPYWIRVAGLTSGQTMLSKSLQIIASTADCTPIANAGGPYIGCVGQPVFLSALASTQRLGSLVAAVWDLNNDGVYNDASGFQVQNAWSQAGTYTIGVKVTSQGAGQTLIATATTTVKIEVCECITDLSARAKLDKIQLVWSPSPNANTYDIYRSTSPWFMPSAANLIKSGLKSDYVTYLDQGLNVGQSYWYKVISVSSKDFEVCISKEAGATAMPRTGNVPPAANAGPDQVVAIGSKAFLTGAGSFDGNGQTLKYKWRVVSRPAGSAATLSSLTIVNPNFTADVRGAYEIELIVNDGTVDSLPDTVRITTPNTAPIADAGPDQMATVGSTVSLTGLGSSDPNGDPLTYRWFISSRPATSAASIINPNTAQPTLTLDAAGTYTLNVIVNDGIADSFPDSMTIQTINSAPTARMTVAKLIVGVGQVDALNGTSSSDPDNDLITFQWTIVSAPAGSLATLTTPTAATSSLTPDSPGNYQIKLVVHDGLLASAPALATITANASPTASAGADQVGQVGALVNLSGVNSSDPESDPLQYLWSVFSAPAGSPATIVSPTTATPTFTPDKKGQYKIRLTVSDPYSSSPADEMLINVVNTPPVANAGPDREIPIGLLAAVSGSASSDVDGDPLTYTWTLIGAPPGSGATLNSSSGVSTTFTPDAPGTYSVKLLVNDGTADSLPVTVKLTTANRPPTANAGTDQSKFLGSVFMLDGGASSDPDNDLLSYVWVVLSRPVGSIAPLQNANTVTPSIVPDVVGAYQIQLTVNDGRGGSAIDTIDLVAKPYVIGPDLSGLNEAQARQAIQSAGLTVGQVTTRSDEIIPTGIVLEQIPGPGIKLDPGAIVNLVVSSGPDVQTPSVSITANPTFVQLGDTVTLTVHVIDDGVINNVTLIVDGLPILLFGNQASFSVTSPGAHHAEATATDAVGHIGHSELNFYVIDPSDTTPPTVQITEPADNSDVSKPTEVKGSVFDPSGQFAYYTVEYAPVSLVDLSTLDSPAFVQIGSGTTEVNNGTLATFDPTTLQNDSYLIRVTAWDQNGQGQREYVIVNATGSLKLGEFKLEFTDLIVPLSGMNIQITRTYSSMESVFKGDFGHGWRLGLRDARIFETKRDIVGYRTFYPGTKVYINTPDGRRVGFTAYTKSDGGFLFPYLVEVALKPDAGVYEKLEFKGIAPGINAWYVSGGYLGGLASEAFDPNDYVLTTRDGKKYEYSQADGLQKVTDLNANRLEFTYDGIFHYAAGQVVADQQVDFTRDSEGRITQITDPAGHILKYTYDAVGDLRTFTDPVNNLTQYTYHAARPHYLETIIDPFGHQLVRTEYDANGRVTGLTDASGNSVAQGFDLSNNTVTMTDPRGHLTITQYDDRGNVIKTRDQLGNVTEFQYDANNNELWKKDPRGAITQHTYDASGNILTLTDPLGNETKFTRNSQGRPTHVEDALGHKIDFIYDAQHNLIETIDDAGNQSLMGRDGAGRLTSHTDPAGHTTTYEYDTESQRRPSKITNPGGSVRQYQYDSRGNATSIINELGAQTQMQYDAIGRVTSITDAQGHQATYQYNGPVLSTVTDPLGKTTHYEYDTLLRTNQITGPTGNPIRFEYDASGNRTKLTDALGHATTYDYDHANRLITETDSAGKARTYGYDVSGNRVEMIDRNGNRRTFEYDLLNRTTAEHWWSGSAISRTTTYGYNAVGAETVIEDPAARYQYSYDSLNRRTKVEQTNVPGQPNFTLNYTYTPIGSPQSVTDNYGVTVNTVYDDRNRLITRAWDGPGVNPARTDYTYDNASRRTRMDRFSDTAGTTRIGHTEYSYDTVDLPAHITHRGPAGALLAQYDYTRDAANQITTWGDDGNASTYTYDPLGQLTSAQHTTTPNETYVYDAEGNRSGVQSGGTYSTGVENRILSDATYNYNYDFEGNLTRKTSIATGNYTSYSYDFRNRLTEATDKTSADSVLHTTTYIYDAINRRIAKTVDGVTTRFLYDHKNSWADLDAANTVSARYLYGARVDELIARYTTSDGTAWYLADHIGTVRKIVDGAGGLIADLKYASFGIRIAPVSPAADRFGFQGRELDSETGFYYFRARYYSPELGRFISPDPLGFSVGDDNLYRFVGNSPLSGKDPYGLTVAIEYAFRVGKFTGTIKAQVGQPPDEYETSGAIIGYLQGFALANLIAVGEVLGSPDDLHQAFLRAEAKIEALKTYASISQRVTDGFVGGYFGGISGGDIKIKIGPLLLKQDLTPSVGGLENGLSDGLDWIKACGIQ